MIRDKARVYKLVLKPGESHQTLYGFHHCVVVFADCKVGGGGAVMERARGDVFWRDGPVHVLERNDGEEELCFFIFEYRVWPHELD